MPRLVALTEIMPDRKRELQRRCALNRTFSLTCEDYEAADKLFKYWSKMEGETAKAEEYRVLVAELEAEIIAYLDTVEPDDDQGKYRQDVPRWWEGKPPP